MEGVWNAWIDMCVPLGANAVRYARLHPPFGLPVRGFAREAVTECSLVARGQLLD